MSLLEVEGQVVVPLHKRLIVLLVVIHLDWLEGVEIPCGTASVLRGPNLILELFMQLLLLFLQREDLDPVLFVLFSQVVTSLLQKLDISLGLGVLQNVS